MCIPGSRVMHIFNLTPCGVHNFARVVYQILLLLYRYIQSSLLKRADSKGEFSSLVSVKDDSVLPQDIGRHKLDELNIMWLLCFYERFVHHHLHEST